MKSMLQITPGMGTGALYDREPNEMGLEPNKIGFGSELHGSETL